jgi:hypothetical protein
VVNERPPEDTPVSMLVWLVWVLSDVLRGRSFCESRTYSFKRDSQSIHTRSQARLNAAGSNTTLRTRSTHTLYWSTCMP